MDYSAQRVGVFVDVQNMYYSARALYEQRVDFGEILKAAVGDRQLVRAFAYVIKADKSEEDSFFTALQDRGYELRSKDLLTFYGGNQKGDWDVGLAMDVVRMAPKLDVVVIVSGDGDFADLINYVKDQGCRAEVVAFGSSASSALREVTDQLIDMSEDTKRFLIPKKGQRPARAAARTNTKPALPKSARRITAPKPVVPKSPTTPKTTARPAAKPKPVSKPSSAPRTNSKRRRTPRITA